MYHNLEQNVIKTESKSEVKKLKIQLKPVNGVWLQFCFTWG